MRKIITVLVALSVTTLLPQSADARKTTPDLKIFTTNIGAGAECAQSCMATVENQITTWHPDAIMVQEVCKSDVDAFSQQHPDWSVLYRPVFTTLDACGGQSKGDLVASSTPFERSQMVDLPGDTETKDYGTPCADIGPTWVCSVHLANVFGTDEANQTKLDQNKALVAATSSWSKVVVGGDFNSRPINSVVWAPFTANNYVETDRADNEFTQGPSGVRVSKYDYIWYHRGSAVSPASVNGVVISQPSSNHDILRGTVTW